MITQSHIESEPQLVERAVTELARRTRFPVAFGGLEHAGAVHVTSIFGARTHNLDGLVVQASRGLGGRALVERRPRLALDYRSSRSITHDYDSAILGEGIATLFAVPVLVSGRARGVLYCGSWGEGAVADVDAGPALSVADELATDLRVNEEVERRLARTPVDDSRGMAPAVREELRESYAELRSISASVGDAAVRARLARLEERLAALSTGGDGSVAPTGDIRLSPRETDVLACAAMGATNAEVAATLGLKEGTVKSYLQSAMAKLDASTRHSAVTKARLAGILP